MVSGRTTRSGHPEQGEGTVIVFGSPFRYYQGYGILDTVGKTLAPMGNNFFLIGDAFVFDLLGDRLETSFAAAGRACARGLFNGECTSAEVERLRALYTQLGCDAVVGIGGGKAADTAKAVAILMNAPVAIVPTVASSDAPVSHVAIVYNEDHSLDRVAFMRYAPWCVFMDTEIILRAPLRLFVSGIGDAAATKFEADACLASGVKNGLRGFPPRTAKALCDLCWDIIREHSLEAIEAVTSGRHNDAFEQVVEATTLLSGLGFENGGLATAHAVSSGLTTIPSTLTSTHGETVAFGLLVQFALEKRSPAFLRDMFDFMLAVGLPVTLEQIGLLPHEHADLQAMTRAVCTPPNIIFNMPQPVTPDLLDEAIHAVDRMGQECLRRPGPRPGPRWGK